MSRAISTKSVQSWTHILKLAAHLPALAVLLSTLCGTAATQSTRVPPQVASHRQFLSRRGRRLAIIPSSPPSQPNAQPAGTPAETPVWTPAGPMAVKSLNFGLVTGRISALAFDPTDPTGNNLFVGTTGGGLWKSQNASASNTSSVVFTPVTDNLAVLAGVPSTGISIGAITIQPGGTGVVLAGLGDTNDALDSYYGAGILRSTDGGKTWALIQQTVDVESGLSTRESSFVGLGFAGFAWSTNNVQLVVAAVNQAYDGTLVNATLPQKSANGLYYSQDGGATWHMARITDGNGMDVSGPLDSQTQTTSNGATSIIWNPYRNLFIAAVNSHGYYQSPDGVTFTRIPAQPGLGLTPANCPTEPGYPGAPSCPIFRGTLAVNPLTGDTLAWTVDAFNQDQGIWQDQCNLNGSTCSNSSIAFGNRLPSAALETSSIDGDATIQNGDYNLALAALPSSQDTLLFAGANDLWKCSIANGCTWRNTTNSTTCMSAQVGEYQHTLAWDAGNPLLLFIGNDSGLWRSTDDVAETGAVCSATDATHIQNMNAALGSLAEVESLAQSGVTPATMIAGLGSNGVSGVVGNPATPGDWSEILGGEGGPVAIDPTSHANNWFANNGAGVQIFNCNSSALCTPSGFGTAPVVGESQVSNDGLTMPFPAPFIMDSTLSTDILIGTCRVWRGASNGSGWSPANAISPILDGLGGTACNGNALIRSMAAQALNGGGENIYVGMAGVDDGGATVPGHLFTATVSPVGIPGTWTDISFSPVINSGDSFNIYGYDVSGLYADPHDPTAGTIYAAIEGIAETDAPIHRLYSSTDAGKHWVAITENLPNAPVNAVAVDPQDANTVYVATDAGVYLTRQISTCVSALCWSAYGSGLPMAPVTQLVVTPASATAQTLTAGTYGRGVWQIPLASAGLANTTASATPASLTFGSLTLGLTSSAQTITLKVTGAPSLTVSSISITGSAPADFSETDTCTGLTLKTNSTCTIKVSFTPSQTGARNASLAISANVAGGEILVPVAGTGLSTASLTLLPAALSFGSQQVSTTSATQTIAIENTGGSSLSLTSATVSAPFKKAVYTCTGTLAAGTACAITIDFAPTAPGPATGLLTLVDSLGTQTAQLTGTGITGPTDTLSAASIVLPSTPLGSTSSPVTVQLTNSGGLPLTSIGTSISGDFSVVGNCGGTLPPGSSCSFSVTFAPTAIGTRVGALIISDALRSQSVSLQGTGQVPAKIKASPTAVSFGSVQVNVPSAPRTITISNLGGQSLANPGFTLTGPGATSFNLGATTCTATVVYGSPCTLQIIFTPLASGATSATLTISSSTPGVAQVAVALSGIGLTPPMLRVSPAQIDFGSVDLQFSSNAFNVQVQNVGQVAMNLPSFAITGANSADFALSQPADIAPCTGSLAPAAICNIQVTFSPGALGQRTSSLVVTSTNAIPPQAAVSLSGTGIPLILVGTVPAQLTFPPTAVQSVSAVQTLAVNNLSRLPLSGLAFSVNGPYQLVTVAKPCSTKLTTLATCNIGVTFNPTASGDEPGILTISVTNSGVSPLLVPLDGTGLAVYQISTAPSQLTFGSSTIKTSTAPQTLVISNTTGSPLTGLAISSSGDFSLVQNQCPVTLAATATCTTGVVFTPSVTGNRTGTITVSTTAAQVSPAVVPLYGTGVPIGSLTASPAVVQFGSVTMTQSSAPWSVTLVNPGAALTGAQFIVAGDFSMPQNNCGTLIATGATCTFTVTFNPSQPGTRIGSVTIQSTASGYTPVTVGLTGNGLPAAALSVSPQQLIFGSIPLGSNSPPQLLTIANSGIAPVTGLFFTATPPFSVGSGNCGSILLPGGSCSVPVIFAPTAGDGGSGLRNGVATVSTSSLGVPPVHIVLSGMALLPASISISPASIAFPGTTVTTASARQLVSLSNPGAYPVSGLQIQITGDFQQSASTCNATLPAQGSCSVQVAFAPATIGGRQGLLIATSTTAGVGSVSTSLTGVGLTAPDLVISPAQLSFPATLISQTSAVQKVSLSNSGQTPIPDLHLIFAGAFKLDPATTTCTGSLPGGASCVAGILFAPATGGALSGSLTASSSLVNSLSGTPATVALSGVGALPPAIFAAPGTVLVFPTTGLQITSAPITVTVTNTGTLSSLNNLALSLDTAAQAAGFAISSTTCTAALAPGASCIVKVTLTPTATGPLPLPPTTANLLISSSAASVPTKLQLTGTGFDFTLTAVNSTTATPTATVVPGQTAFYTFTVTPLGASSGTITYQCATLPATTNAPVCLLNPSTQASLPANVQGQGMLAVATNGPIAHSGFDQNSPGPVHSFVPVVLVCSLIMLPFARMRPLRSKLRLWLPGLLLVATLVGLVFGVTSCAGAGSGGGSTGKVQQTGGTPTGTYTTQITATASGVVRTTTVTLVVN